VFVKLLDVLMQIPQIPVQPISWSDAAPLLAAIGGPTVPSQWQGGLNFTYHIGMTKHNIQNEPQTKERHNEF
jgi:N-acetylated-alpha-linked acidic dipeptidase